MHYELQNLLDTLVSICVVNPSIDAQRRFLCAMVSICDEIHHSPFIIHN